MRRKIQLSMSRPCHERYADMQPTTSGAFCSQCRKEVIDFTTWSEAEIKLYFSRNPLNVCARLRASQLTTYSLYEPARPPLMTLFLASSLLLAVQQETTAQVPSTHQEQRTSSERRQKSTSPSAERFIIQGRIVSAEDGVGIAGASVLLKGTSHGTVADAEGRFSIEVPVNREPVLVFSFIGFNSLEKDYRNKISNEESLVELHFDLQMVGEVVVLGGVCSRSYRWYKPRTWLWRIKRLFR
jgi:hypothetical protein